MRFLSHFITLTIILVCFVAEGTVLKSVDEDLGTHLKTYSNFNMSHHDNIDNSEHTHTHKHSESGEEHQHEHDHSLSTQLNYKFMTIFKVQFDNTSLKIASNHYNIKTMLSSDHPHEVFRPPIH